jgi:Mce-associated membrane protein
VSPRRLITRRPAAGQDEAEPVEEERAAPPEPSESGPRLRIRLPRRVPSAVLAGVAALATVLAVVSGVSAHELRTGGAAGNRALTDVAGTEDVIDAVTEAVETVFSYEYRDTARTREAALELLVGPAVEQYEALFAQVERQASARGTVLSTAVRSIGVVELRDDHASLLLFVDQQILQTGDGTHTSGATQLSISAVRSGDAWKIDGITVL